MKETVKLIDGTEKEIELTFLGARKASQLKSKYMNITKLLPEGNGIKSLEGVFDFEGLSLAVIEEVTKNTGLNLDYLEPLEKDRLYNKYYAKIFNPNEESDAEKK